mgnify:CR=1 FL=1
MKKRNFKGLFPSITPQKLMHGAERPSFAVIGYGGQARSIAFKLNCSESKSQLSKGNGKEARPVP